jgi:hypothetical protein
MLSISKLIHFLQYFCNPHGGPESLAEPASQGFRQKGGKRKMIVK